MTTKSLRFAGLALLTALSLVAPRASAQQGEWVILRKLVWPGDRPNCFEFYLADITKTGADLMAAVGPGGTIQMTPYGARQGWGVDPSAHPPGVGPFINWEAGDSFMGQLSSYGGDFYGCNGPSTTVLPPRIPVAPAPAPTPVGGGAPPVPAGSPPRYVILRHLLWPGDRPNCFEFYLSDIYTSAPRAALVNGLPMVTAIGAREGWEVDPTLGGPYRFWEAADSSMNKLSRFGGDLYGCNNTPVPPTPTPRPPNTPPPPGTATPVPPTPPTPPPTPPTPPPTPPTPPPTPPTPPPLTPRPLATPPTPPPAPTCTPQPKAAVDWDAILAMDCTLVVGGGGGKSDCEQLNKDFNDALADGAVLKPATYAMVFKVMADCAGVSRPTPKPKSSAGAGAPTPPLASTPPTPPVAATPPTPPAAATPPTPPPLTTPPTPPPAATPPTPPTLTPPPTPLPVTPPLLTPPPTAIPATPPPPPTELPPAPTPAPTKASSSNPFDDPSSQSWINDNQNNQDDRGDRVTQTAQNDQDSTIAGGPKPYNQTNLQTQINQGLTNVKPKATPKPAPTPRGSPQASPQGSPAGSPQGPPAGTPQMTPQPGKTPSSGGGLTDVTVTKRRITVTYWDHGTQDGDIIDILLDGKPVKSGIVLTTAKQSTIIEIQGASSVFGVRAVNEGSISPNTATVVFSDVTKGKDLQTYEINSGQKTDMNIIYGGQ